MIMSLEQPIQNWNKSREVRPKSQFIYPMRERDIALRCLGHDGFMEKASVKIV
jgi:hypothetical protein